jgi:hypothetical protein
MTGGRLEFATPDGLRLAVHADIPIKRHVQVKWNGLIDLTRMRALHQHRRDKVSDQARNTNQAESGEVFTARTA